MWSKGAVVVVKHGDIDISNAVADGLGMTTVPSQQLQELDRDNYFLRRYARKNYINAINRARELYGHNPPPPPKWAKPFIDIWALIVYWFSTLVEKCLKKG